MGRDPGRDLFVVEGFGGGVAGAGLETLELVGGVGPSRHEDDGQHHIEQHQVGIDRPRLLEGSLASGRSEDLAVFIHETIDKHLEVGRRVVDNQDRITPFGCAHRQGSIGAGWPAGGGKLQYTRPGLRLQPSARARLFLAADLASRLDCCV